MPSRILCKIVGAQGRIIAQASRDRIDPVWALTAGFAIGALHELPHGRTKLHFFRIRAAQPHQRSRFRARASAQPLRHRRIRHVSKPRRIELDLDLLETERTNDIAMRSARPKENRRRAGNDRLAEFGLVGTAAEYAKREQRPIMRMLRNARSTPVDNSSDLGSAEIAQTISIPGRRPFHIGRAKRSVNREFIQTR